MVQKITEPLARYEYQKSPSTGEWVPVMKSGSFTPFARQTLTVAATAIGLTLPIRAVNCVVMSLETAQIRFWLHGEDPTATVGHLMEVGETRILESQQEIKGFKAIRTGSTSGVLQITYEV